MSGDPNSGLHLDADADSKAAPPELPFTAAHPPASKPDPTATQTENGNKRGLTAAHASSSTELASLKVTLKQSLRQFKDWPEPGILFEDILPIFANPATHENLLRALELQIASNFGAASQPQVVVGLEARGFLFGPSLALRLGAGFVPIRKKGKLPGDTKTASFKKEYGEDLFQIQSDAIKPGQKVVIVDDIIATGGTAAAAGSLVKQLGGELLGYVFMMELDFLKGRTLLDAPVCTLLSSQ